MTPGFDQFLCILVGERLAQFVGLSAEKGYAA